MRRQVQRVTSRPIAKTLFAAILDPTSQEVWQARAQVLKALNRPPEAEQAIARKSAFRRPPK